MEKRNKPMSLEQKNILIEFIRCNPQLKEKFSSTFTRQDSIALWKNITNSLNSTPGATKEWKDWRKSWHDIQSRTKTKKAHFNSHALKTGGGPAISDLSASDEKIIEIIGDTAISGLVGVVEPQAEEIDLDAEISEINESENKHISEKKTSKTRNFAAQRLDKAVEQSNETMKLLRGKIKIKKEYYTKKLLLMERSTVAKESIAAELKDLKEILLNKSNSK